MFDNIYGDKNTFSLLCFGDDLIVC